MSHVYIVSHPADEEFVGALTLQVMGAGFAVWGNHTEDAASVEWSEAKDEAIRDAFAVLVVITPAALVSPQVTYEWTFALGVGVTTLVLTRAPITLPPQLARLETLEFEDNDFQPWGMLIHRLHIARSRSGRERLSGGVSRRGGERRSDEAVGDDLLPDLLGDDGPAQELPGRGAIDPGGSFLDRMRREITPSPDSAEPDERRLGRPSFRERPGDRFGDRFSDHPSERFRERPHEVPLNAPDAVARLTALLDPAQTRECRIAAAHRLAQTGNPAAVAALAKALRDPDARVREAVAAALGQFKAANAVVALLEGLRFWRPGPFGGGNNQPMVDAIRAIGPASVPVLIDALSDEDPRIRLHAIDLLCEMDEPEVWPGLVEALRDPEWRIRLQAADGLGRLGRTEAVSHLVALLRDPAGEVRIAAATALGRIGSEAAVSGLARLLRDREWRARWTAAEALRQIGEAAIPELINLLVGEETELTRRAAMQTLAAIGAAAIPALMEVLRQTDWDRRLTAAETLVMMGAPAVPPLVAALHEGDWRLGWTVAEALKRIGTPDALAAVAAWREG